MKGEEISRQRFQYADQLNVIHNLQQQVMALKATLNDLTERQAVSDRELYLSVQARDESIQRYETLNANLRSLTTEPPAGPKPNRIPVPPFQGRSSPYNWSPSTEPTGKIDLHDILGVPPMARNPVYSASAPDQTTRLHEIVSSPVKYAGRASASGAGAPQAAPAPAIEQELAIQHGTSKEEQVRLLRLTSERSKMQANEATRINTTLSIFALSAGKPYKSWAATSAQQNHGLLARRHSAHWTWLIRGELVCCGRRCCAVLACRRFFDGLRCPAEVRQEEGGPGCR
jgi:hypothetical protein